MHESAPHTTLLSLHQLVDTALYPLYAPLELAVATESIVTITRDDLAGLVTPDVEPQAAIVTISRGTPPAVVIAEPSLCSTVLARMWRSTRNTGAPLTQVEGEILRQHLADITRQWRSGWRGEGIELEPTMALAGGLSMLQGQLAPGTWHAARTVVVSGSEAVGVLLFCYPATLIPALAAERQRTSWRARVSNGPLSPRDAERARTKLGRLLPPLPIAAPVKMSTTLPLGVINALERGDVISFDLPVGGAVDVTILDRTLTAQLARTNDHLAVAVTGMPGAQAPAPEAPTEMDDADADLSAQHHEPINAPSYS